MSIFNLFNGIEIECYNEEDDKPARVVVRGDKGERKALIIASVQDGLVTFKQALPIRKEGGEGSA